MKQPKPTISRYCPLSAFSFGLSLKVFKTRLLGRDFHTLIKNALFSSPTNMGSHNPPPLGPASLLAYPLMSTPYRAQPPRWHITWCLALIPFVTTQCSLWAFPFGFPLKVFKMHLLGRGFHTLIKNVSFSSPTNMGSHIPPPSGPSILADTHSLLQSMWTPQSTPFGPSVLAGIPPHVHPLRVSVSSLGHRPVSGSNTICNSPMSSLGFPFRTPQGF